MRKRGIAAALTTGLALLVAACGSAQGGTNTGNTGAGSSAEISSVAPAQNTEESPAQTPAQPQTPAETPSQTEKGETLMTENTVTVSGVGRIDVTPDKAELSVGVSNDAPTAKESQEQNSQTINAIIEKLKEAGVPESSIRTTGFYMNQNYDYNTNKVIGYHTEATLTVSDREIDEVGTLLSLCTEAGANIFHGINFTSSSYDEAYGNALGTGVEEARKKAEALAKAAGRTLGGTVEIREGYQDTSARYRNANLYMESAKEEAMADMAVMPGTLEVNAYVTVTYILE